MLATANNDLHIDRNSSAANSKAGEVITVWAKDSSQPDVFAGSSVVVSQYNGSSWDVPVELQEANHFNKDTEVVYANTDNPMVVWSSASANGITPSTIVTDALTAMQQSDIFFSQRVDGIWTTPVAAASLPGSDGTVQIASSGNGEVIAAWLNSDSDILQSSSSPQTIYTSIWNGTDWSVPTAIATNDLVGSPSIAYANNTPVLAWTQGTDGDEDTTDDFTIHYIYWDGAWSTPSQLDKPSIGDAFRYQTLQAQRRISSLQLFSWPEPPDECCKLCPDEDNQANCEKPDPADPTFWEFDNPPRVEVLDVQTTESVEANDPNEKVATPGVRGTDIIVPGDRIEYTIYFENVITATAPAQEVFITDLLSIDLDWNTIRFEEVAFDKTIVAIDDGGGNQFQTRQQIVDYRDGDNRTWWVDIFGILDPSTGLVEWTFRTLDPETGDLPIDALAGFLPPNDDTKRGEGHVTFSILPKADIPLGTEIRNKASIIFDINDAIITNEVRRVIDVAPPEEPDGSSAGSVYLPIMSSATQ